MSVCIRRVFAASLLVLALPGWGQHALTLDQALRTAVARSQQLVAADAAAAAARELARTAGELPDPVLRAGVDNVPLGGPDRLSLSGDIMTMAHVGVMQELTRGEKRRLRAERGSREVARTEARRRAQLAGVRRATALAWIERHDAQAQLALLQEQLQEVRLQVEAAALAFRTGRGQPADVFAGRAALAILQDALRGLQQRERAAGLMLARWAGPSAATASLVGAVPWQQAPLAGPLAQLLPQHPELLVLVEQVAAAETDWKLAQADQHPDVTVQASYQRRGPGHADMFSVGISVPLPVSRGQRQDRQVAARLALLEEARARYADTLVAEEAALGALQDEWAAARQRLAALQADLVPAAQDRVQAALAAYRAGKADLATVLGAREAQLEVRSRLLALESEAARLWARLHYTFPRDADTQEQRP